MLLWFNQPRKNLLFQSFWYAKGPRKVIVFYKVYDQKVKIILCTQKFYSQVRLFRSHWDKTGTSNYFLCILILRISVNSNYQNTQRKRVKKMCMSDQECYARLRVCAGRVGSTMMSHLTLDLFLLIWEVMKKMPLVRWH